MARNAIRADEWLLGRFKRRFSKRQWMSLFGGHPIPLGGGAPVAPPFSPTDIVGMKMWLDFSDLATLFQDIARTSPITTDGQTILAVLDKSATVTQYQNNPGPVYKENIQNGLSVARFDGINNLLGSSALVHNEFGTGDFYFIGVIKNSNPVGAIGGIWNPNDLSGKADFWIQKTDNVFGTYDGLTYRAFTITSSITSPQIVEFWRESGVLKLAVDGVVDATTHAMADSMSEDTGWLVGRSWSGSQYRFTGDMCEQIVYKGLPTILQRAALRAYLDAKWAIF